MPDPRHPSSRAGDDHVVGVSETSGRPTPKISSDFWTLDDRLGHSLIADAIANFIRHPDTSPPFTIALRSAPGMGKTSLMRMIRERLDSNRDATTDRHGYPTVWFSAMTSQTDEEALAGLASAMVRQLMSRLTAMERERLLLKFSLFRVNVYDVKRAATLERLVPAALSAAAAWFLAVAVLLAAPALVGTTAWAQLTAGVLIGLSGIVLTLFAAVSYRKTRVRALEPPEYVGGGEDSRSHDDIRQVVELVSTRDRPVVVFVDDLDRCAPAVVAKIVEALNVFLAGEIADCIFIIAMDPDVVAARMEVAYKDLLEGLDHASSGGNASGWRFLETTVQLPLNLPTPEPEQLLPLVDMRLSDRLPPGRSQNEVDEARAALGQETTQEEIVSSAAGSPLEGGLNSERDAMTLAADSASRAARLELAADRLSDAAPTIQAALRSYLDVLASPRDVKRFLNVFRFYSYIAFVRTTTGSPRATADEVGKFAALTVRWPHLLGFLTTPHPSERSTLAYLEILADRRRDQITGEDPWRRELERARLPEKWRNELIADHDLRAVLARRPQVGHLNGVLF